jgi:Cu/Ag efflux protein CusF
MPPMRMAFWVQSPQLLEGLEKGDRVRFSFKVEDPLIVIYAITKTKN